MYKTHSFNESFFENENSALFPRFSPFECFIPEILSLKAGIRRIFMTHLYNTQNTLPLLKRICQDNGLQILVDNHLSATVIDGGATHLVKAGGSVKTGGQNLSQYLFVYISKERAFAEKARFLWNAQNQENKFEFSQLLGYPDCCISQFQEKNMGIYTKYVYSCFENSRKFYPQLNALSVSRYLPSNPYKLVFHFPCRFDCPESLKLAKVNLQMLKKEDALFAKNLELFLRQPVVYFDEDTLIRFKGRVSGNTINYEDFIIYADEPGKTQLTNLLKESHSISVLPDSITNEENLSFKKSNLLFNFRDS